MSKNKLRKIIQLRQNLNYQLRRFLIKHDYLEVDVPTLSPKLIPESYLEVFKTELKTLDSQTYSAYLLASPEAYLKRLLSQKVGNIFYLGKAFRNQEPFSKYHNHEFTILEWYKINYNYKQLIKEIEQMLYYIVQELDTDIGVDFKPPWEYLTIKEAYKLFVPRKAITNFQNPNYKENFEKNYVQYLEPNLGTRGKPTFILDFPSWQSPLALENAKGRTKTAQRFELYINGVELINGWTELTDWQTQEENLKQENQTRIKLGKEPLPFDTGFIQALKQGIPECAGAAMGVDRLLMVLGGYKSIAEVILFPTKNLFYHPRSGKDY